VTGEKPMGEEHGGGAEDAAEGKRARSRVRHKQRSRAAANAGTGRR
jgi:hypothetical protein